MAQVASEHTKTTKDPWDDCHRVTDAKAPIIDGHYPFEHSRGFMKLNAHMYQSHSLTIQAGTNLRKKATSRSRIGQN